MDMAKRMISFLGTGNYETGVYYFDDFNQQRTAFVQTGLVRFLEPEEVVVLVTDQAEKKNWSKLQAACEEKGITTPFRACHIPSGQSEDEIWQIFQFLSDEVHEQDLLLMDITHSLRSLPIMALACIQYLRSLKGISLQGIYYGAWEAGAEKNKEHWAPIFDLTPFVELMDWSEAVGSFQRSGDSSALRQLFDREVIARQKASKGKDQEAKLLKEVGYGLYQASQRMATCRGYEIYTNPVMSRVTERLQQLETQYSPGKAFNPLLARIREKIESISCPLNDVSDEVKQGFEAVSWCVQHNLVQQAYTLLQENLITHFCQKGGADPWKEADRKLVSSALSLTRKSLNEWSEKALEHEDFIKQIMDSAGVEVLTLYDQLSKKRNDINHGGITNPAKADKLIAEIERYTQQAIDLLHR
jgi:CRISPR-associated DxTHG motif protein